jgi:hypothetical protein
MHEDLVPPDHLNGQDPSSSAWRTEYDVVSTLRKLGHEVKPLGVRSDLGVLRSAIEDWKPHIAFNLLEEFDGVAVYDQNVVSYLELLHVPYTGCNPRGLMLARDKVLSKKLFSFHRIPFPDFMVVPQGRMVKRPKGLAFPLIVKSITEEASLGISQASIVQDDDKLKERVAFIHAHVGTGELQLLGQAEKPPCPRVLGVDAVAEPGGALAPGFHPGQDFPGGLLLGDIFFGRAPGDGLKKPHPLFDGAPVEPGDGEHSGRDGGMELRARRGDRPGGEHGRRPGPVVDR